MVAFSPSLDTFGELPFVHVKVVPCDPEFHKRTQSLRKHYTAVWRKLHIPLLTSSITI